MRKLKVYKCLECGAMSRTRRINCALCGISLLHKGSTIIFYRTNCCEVIIDEHIQFCPQCGGIEDGE